MSDRLKTDDKSIFKWRGRKRRWCIWSSVVNKWEHAQMWVWGMRDLQCADDVVGICCEWSCWLSTRRSMWTHWQSRICTISRTRRRLAGTLTNQRKTWSGGLKETERCETGGQTGRETDGCIVNRRFKRLFCWEWLIRPHGPERQVEVDAGEERFAA